MTAADLTLTTEVLDELEAIYKWHGDVTLSPVELLEEIAPHVPALIRAAREREEWEDTAEQVKDTLREVLSERDAAIAERDRLRADNARLREELDRILKRYVPELGEDDHAGWNIAQEARAALDASGKEKT
jgi:hypothetical protein